MAMAPTQVIMFSSVVAARDADGGFVIAFFDDEPDQCVAILRASEEATRALSRAINFELPNQTRRSQA